MYICGVCVGVWVCVCMCVWVGWWREVFWSLLYGRTRKDLRLKLYLWFKRLQLWFKRLQYIQEVFFSNYLITQKDLTGKGIISVTEFTEAEGFPVPVRSFFRCVEGRGCLHTGWCRESELKFSPTLSFRNSLILVQRDIFVPDILSYSYVDSEIEETVMFSPVCLSCGIVAVLWLLADDRSFRQREAPPPSLQRRTNQCCLWGLFPDGGGSVFFLCPILTFANIFSPQGESSFCGSIEI